MRVRPSKSKLFNLRTGPKPAERQAASRLAGQATGQAASPPVSESVGLRAGRAAQPASPPTGQNGFVENVEDEVSVGQAVKAAPRSSLVPGAFPSRVPAPTGTCLPQQGRLRAQLVGASSTDFVICLEAS